jgi:hypothetical protein
MYVAWTKSVLVQVPYLPNVTAPEEWSRLQSNERCTNRRANSSYQLGNDKG